MYMKIEKPRFPTPISYHEDQDFYDSKSLHDSLENDMISPEEEGFMQGYMNETGDCIV
jgi:hypothetical protein